MTTPTTMGAPAIVNIAALKIYRVGGQYYSLLEKSNGEPTGLGKNLIDEVPTNIEEFEGNLRQDNPPPPQHHVTDSINSVEGHENSTLSRG